MGRFWSILFLMVPILGVGVFVCAMGDIFIYNHWLPLNINDSRRVIDNLFEFILILTGVIFVITSLVLFYFMWKYDADKTTEPVKFTHGSHALEVVWSILPAATLLFIAIYQMNAWADTKLRRPVNRGPDGILHTADDPMITAPTGEKIPEPAPPYAEVMARQFEWRIRYPGADGELYTADDIHTVNDLHVPLNEEVVIRIISQDVLHSFFLPNLRVKQDIVPGMQQHVWFEANQAGVYDIVCAELCGWGHYKMRGRLTVQPRSKINTWLALQQQEQDQSSYSAPSEEDE